MQNENHQTIEINVPISVPFSLIVPEEMDGREGTVRDFAARCSGIIMEAIKWAPETTRSLLQVRKMEPEQKTSAKPPFYRAPAPPSRISILYKCSKIEYVLWRKYIFKALDCLNCSFQQVN